MTPNDASSDNYKCKSILIVEDDKDIRESLSLLLKTYGYNVLEAENGQVAIDLLLTIAAPCLILLDLMMPVMNGWQFVEALRHSNSAIATISVVVVSAFSESVGEISAQAVMKKPVDLDALLEFVKKYCGTPEITTGAVEPQGLTQ